MSHPVQLGRAPVLLSRARHYIKRHGLRAALKRLLASFRRIFSANRFALFYYDLNGLELSLPEPPLGRSLERKRCEAELPAKDLERLLSVSAPEIVRQELAERFAKGASLWLLKQDGQLAAFGWTLVGQTMEPHFVPLAAADAHLFDFYVFPEHRGRRHNPWLVRAILSRLAKETQGRAYLEVAEWNESQLRSLSRTPLREFGVARKFQLWGRTLVIWSDGTVQSQKHGN